MQLLNGEWLTKWAKEDEAKQEEGLCVLGQRRPLFLQTGRRGFR